MKTTFMFLLGATVLGSTSAAWATPHLLPFNYPYATLPEGKTEIETYADMTPDRVYADPAGDPTQGRLWEPRYYLQIESEYGITDRLEGAFYIAAQGEPVNGGENVASLDGFKWRLRYRFAEAGKWPVDVGVYVELETMHDEIALEEKLLLEKQLGRFRFDVNLWIEQPLVRPFDDAQRQLQFIINPTAGGTFQITPAFHVGLEYWARGRLDVSESDPDYRSERVTNFLGPTIHGNFGRVWLTVGLYANLNDMNKPQPGDFYGPLWARALFGVEL